MADQKHLYATEPAVVTAAHNDEKDIQPAHQETMGGTLEQVLHKNLHNTVVEDRQTALELAINADPGPSKLSWRYIRLWMIVFLMCMNQGDGGEFHQIRL